MSEANERLFRFWFPRESLSERRVDSNPRNSCTHPLPTDPQAGSFAKTANEAVY
ncbi:MAG: hypothetical protein NT092_06805 [Bacteroidia bacterium]|nr:hypothetical protein [Bacteroidia bacterium]